MGLVSKGVQGDLGRQTGGRGWGPEQGRKAHPPLPRRDLLHHPARVGRCQGWPESHGKATVLSRRERLPGPEGGCRAGAWVRGRGPARLARWQTLGLQQCPASSGDQGRPAAHNPYLRGCRRGQGSLRGRGWKIKSRGPGARTGHQGGDVRG